jgi:hypothetical protein
VSDRSPSQYRAMRAVAEQVLGGVSVSMPGEIVEYDPAEQRAIVQPMIKRAFIDAAGVRQVSRRAAIPDVPVLFQGGGGSRQTFPVAKGDTVLLVFCDASLDVWLSLGREVDPGDDRSHDVTDAIAIAGLLSFADATPAHPTATVTYGDDVRLGGESGGALAYTAELADLKSAIAAWPGTGTTDGGVSLKAIFSSWLTPGTQKVTAE